MMIKLIPLLRIKSIMGAITTKEKRVKVCLPEGSHLVAIYHTYYSR